MGKLHFHPDKTQEKNAHDNFLAQIPSKGTEMNHQSFSSQFFG